MWRLKQAPIGSFDIRTADGCGRMQTSCRNAKLVLGGGAVHSGLDVADEHMRPGRDSASSAGREPRGERGG